MSKVTNNLFVAGVDETYDIKFKSKVTHFLNVANEVNICDRVDHVYKKIGINDDDECNDIRDIIDECLIWLCNVLGNDKENYVVCVHCLEGKSRSVCICIAYLCIIKGMKYNDAYILMKESRPNIDIFPLYEKQLIQYIEKNRMKLITYSDN